VGRRRPIRRSCGSAPSPPCARCWPAWPSSAASWS
jgi:hypothetical protein